jgi:hypothetical protein
MKKGKTWKIEIMESVINDDHVEENEVERDDPVK